jgi:hypothetical protein
MTSTLLTVSLQWLVRPDVSVHAHELAGMTPR